MAWLFWFSFLIRNVSDIYGIFRHIVWRIFLFVHIWTCNGENGAVIGKAQAGNWCRILKQDKIWNHLSRILWRSLLLTLLTYFINYPLWLTLWNWHNRFLFWPSHILTNPSEPPVANVLYSRWKDIALTGYICSTAFSFNLWHLNAYFLFCTSGLGSRYSTATLPSIELRT